MAAISKAILAATAQWVAEKLNVSERPFTGVNAKGEIVHAMALTNGSMLAAFQGYLEGKYKLDTVGFIGDYALSQMGDWYR